MAGETIYLQENADEDHRLEVHRSGTGVIGSLVPRGDRFEFASASKSAADLNGRSFGSSAEAIEAITAFFADD